MGELLPRESWPIIVGRIKVQLRMVARKPIAQATRGCLHWPVRSLSTDKDLATRVPLAGLGYLDGVDPRGVFERSHRTLVDKRNCTQLKRTHCFCAGKISAFLTIQSSRG